jgi:Uma2 family endonuclease
MVMPAVSRRWTAKEVRQLIADNPLYTPRYELVDGELLVTPSPRQEHQIAIVELAYALRVYLGDQGPARVLVSPSDVELEPEFLSQPDVFVIRNEERERAKAARDGTWRALLLAVEVVSPSSSRHDRVRKRPKYQKHVPEYWIVDLDARLVERWRAGDSRPDILTDRIEWSVAGFPEPFVLELPQYFGRVLD